MPVAAKESRMCHGAVIMASGLGTRFGGNKLLASLAGKPLIGYVLDAVDGLFDRVVVVTRHEDVAALCRRRGVEAVLHDLPHRNDTVRLGMEALGAAAASPEAAAYSTVTFFQADQPLISPATIRQLLAAAEADPASIWRPACDGTPGAPVVFPAWTFRELAELPEGKGGGYLVKKHPEQVRTVPVRDAMELYDVDTQADLAYLEAAIRQPLP